MFTKWLYAHDKYVVKRYVLETSPIEMLVSKTKSFKAPIFKRDTIEFHRVCALFNVLKGAIVNAGQRFVGSLHFIGSQLVGNEYR